MTAERSHEGWEPEAKLSSADTPANQQKRFAADDWEASNNKSQRPDGTGSGSQLYEGSKRDRAARGVDESVQETVSVKLAAMESQESEGDQDDIKETTSVPTRSDAQTRKPGDLGPRKIVLFAPDFNLRTELKSEKWLREHDFRDSTLPTPILMGTDDRANDEEQGLEGAVEAGRARLD